MIRQAKKPSPTFFEFEGQMSEIKHYRYQADQAKRLAHQVSDPAVRVRLLEMADEYARYATLIEARTSGRHITGYGRASVLVEPC